MKLEKWLPILISVVLMLVVLHKIDLRSLGEQLANINTALMVVALLLFLPQIALFSWRWQIMISPRMRTGFYDAFGLILASCTMNLFLPSKIGDLSKAFFLKKQKDLPLSYGLNLVVLEKALDLISLGFVTSLGLLAAHNFGREAVAAWIFTGGLTFVIVVGGWLVSKKSSFVAVKELWDRKSLLAQIFALSLVVWFFQVFQFYLMFKAFRSELSLSLIYQWVPYAILAGVLPVSFSGIGVRDSALLYLLKAYEKPEIIAGVGLFMSVRYLLPGIVGLFYLKRYLVEEVKS